jgi:putative molybdopterin biosynthesis protein
VGIEAAAAARGLDFLPLVQEQYFLVTLRSSLAHPHLRSLLELLASPEWQQELRRIPGYLPADSAQVLSLNKVLPWWRYRKPKAPADRRPAPRKADDGALSDH